MRDRVEALVTKVMLACVKVSYTHAIAVTASIALATLAAGNYASKHLGINADMDEMISPELPHRILEREQQNKFPMLSDTAVIVIDGDTHELASDATEALAARLQGAPEVFKHVFVPRGRFFEDHALLYRETHELEDLADRLARVQPYLAGLAKDGTLRGLCDILSRALRAVRDGDIEGSELLPMFDRFSEAIDAQRAGQTYRLSWAEVVADREFDANEKRRFIIVHPSYDYTNLLPAHRMVETVRGFVRDLALDPAHGVRVRMTGKVVLSYEEMPLVRRQVAIAGAASTILVAILLTIALRSARLVVANLAMLTAGLTWTAAFAALAIGHLNMISISFYVLFIGLGGDLGIHPSLRYRELLAEGRTHAEALRGMARSTGASLFLCAAATAIGFYTFVPTDFKGIAELGLISGTSMFISLLLIFTLMPAIMSIGRPPDTRLAAGSALPVRSLPAFPARHPRLIAGIAFSAAVGGMVLVPRVSFDRNPLRVRDPGAESVRTFEELLDDADSTPWTLSALADDVGAAEEMTERLRELPEVARAITVSDFIPEDQEEKLAILEDVAMFMAPPPDAAGLTEPSPAAHVQAIEELRIELTQVEGERHAGGLKKSAERLRVLLADFLETVRRAKHPTRVIEPLEASLLESLPYQLDALQRAISAGPITLEKLPAMLIDRMVSEHGDVRVEIYPKEDVRDDAAMESFIEAVRSVAPDVTGGAIGIYETSRTAVGALRQALVSAVIVIAILLFVIWRTVGEVLLVMAPLALASILTAALALLFGIPFNFADIIVLPLLLGIGVDSGIHLVDRWRQTGAPPEVLLRTSTARGVVFSALTTIASFATLSFATHRGMASLGQLLTVGVAMVVVCNLIVLPALIELRMRGR